MRHTVRLDIEQLKLVTGFVLLAGWQAIIPNVGAFQQLMHLKCDCSMTGTFG